MMGFFKDMLMGNEGTGSTGILGGLMSSMGGGLGGLAVGGLQNMFGMGATNQAKDMMDTLYPDTTPFERLSAGGGGAAGAGGMESLSQKALNAQIANQKAQQDIAKRQVNASITNTERTAQATEYAAERHADRVTLPFGFSYYPENDDWKGKKQTERLYRLPLKTVEPRTSLENNTPRRKQGVIGPYYNPMQSPWLIN